jgi:hypothetical protein
MATHKRIDGDYFITSVNATDNVIIDTHTVEVLGNLDVSGNLTYINVTELNIRDPFILLNASNTGSYASNSGVLTHETASTFAGIRYNATAGEWQLSTGTDTTGLTGTWTPIAIGGTVTPGGADTNIQFNDSGTFGGNANLSFDKTTGKVTLQGHFALGNIGASPVSTANAVTLYNAVQGSGGTGLYVKSSTVDDELVSKSAAIVFSIIF